MNFIDSKNGYRLKFIDADTSWKKIDNLPFGLSFFIPYPFDEPKIKIAVGKEGTPLYALIGEDVWEYSGRPYASGGSISNRLKYYVILPKYVTKDDNIRVNALVYTILGFMYGGSKNPNTYIRYTFDKEGNSIRDNKNDIKARVLQKGINYNVLGGNSIDTINHKDNDSSNNDRDNLEVVSRKENTVLDNAVLKKYYKNKEDLLKDYPSFKRNYFFTVK